MFDDAIAQMKRRGIVFEAGLSDAEIASVQEKYGFAFPPDLRLFLQTALPVDLPPDPDRTWKQPFPNWRAGSKDDLHKWCDFLLEGVLFDVEHARFWLDTWGERPNILAEAFKVARKKFAEVPKLIPIYAHRFIPESPCEAGNPIFSVYQTDIIYYGSDLSDYLQIEFAGAKFKNSAIPKRIPFWSMLATGEEDEERKYARNY